MTATPAERDIIAAEALEEFAKMLTTELRADPDSFFRLGLANAASKATQAARVKRIHAAERAEVEPPAQPHRHGCIVGPIHMGPCRCSCGATAPSAGQAWSR